jgi:hypothetical protein
LQLRLSCTAGRRAAAVAAPGPARHSGHSTPRTPPLRIADSGSCMTHSLQMWCPHGGADGHALGRGREEALQAHGNSHLLPLPLPLPHLPPPQHWSVPAAAGAATSLVWAPAAAGTRFCLCLAAGGTRARALSTRPSGTKPRRMPPPCTPHFGIPLLARQTPQSECHPPCTPHVRVQETGPRFGIPPHLTADLQ